MSAKARKARRERELYADWEDDLETVRDAEGNITHCVFKSDAWERADAWERRAAERDPLFAAELAEQAAREMRLVPVTCAWGWCTEGMDPIDGRLYGGGGPTACPHDHLPGWKSPYPQGRPRPATPAKARGRHGSRVHRSKRRHQAPSYATFFGWLPARCNYVEPSDEERDDHPLDFDRLLEELFAETDLRESDDSQTQGWSKKDG